MPAAPERSEPGSLRSLSSEEEHMATTLITNGTIVSATGRTDGDVLIDGETIVEVGAVGHRRPLVRAVADLLAEAG